MLKNKIIRMMSLMIVATFIITAFAVAVPASEGVTDNTSSTPYELSLFVGDSFSYTPTFTISSGVTLAKDSASTNCDWISVNSTTHAVTGTATAAAQAANSSVSLLKLTATHSDSSQTSVQWIKFNVYKRIAISTTEPSKNYVVIGGSNLTRTYSVATQTSISPTYTVTVDGSTVTNYSSWLTLPTTAVADGGSATITVAAASVPAAYANKQVVVKVGGSDASSGDSISSGKECSVSFMVYSKLTVSPASTSLNAVEGGSFTSKTFTATSDATSSFTYSIVSQKIDNVATTKFSITGNTLSMTGTYAAVSGESDSYVVQVRATNNSDSSDYADAYVNITVWDTLQFTNTPSSGNVTSNKTNSFMVSAQSSTNGAAYTVWDFGDGTMVRSYDSAVDHVYSRSGMFTVKQTSYNSNGVAFQPTYYIVEVGDGISDAFNDAKDDVKGFFDDHGYGTVIFAIVAIVLFIIGYFVTGDIRLVYGSALSAILAVVFYFVNLSVFGFLF